ncbi:hypothetical protein MED134_07059 [Dokdonia sp. MED134]|uniref:exodeoxyribonuclease X C-terminal domain-containing protein n=1 Tax=Dokdonia sp. MED134 TaxID=313590 RepID=UPI000068AC13|nr:hypothetical protein [Dokdonia sp. MED134]EAQ40495.1 hypothetical protein MED134_07059 [Dokdonia sp. MED134]
MTIYNPSEKMPYGKNKGVELKEIYKYQPSYIEWAIINIDDFCIEIDAFESLGSVTTINYHPKHFDLSRIKPIDQSNLTPENLDYILNERNAMNAHMDVETIKEFVLNNPLSIEKLDDFKFPEHIRAINAYKIFLATKK